MGHAESHRAAHEAFNARDYDGVARNMHVDMEFHDHARQQSAKGVQEMVEYLRGWASAFSDAGVAEARYLEGADHSIALFHAKGTNDGPFGPFPATGRSIYVPFCEVMHYDAEGRGVRGELYYDATAFLVQLGHVEAPGDV